MTVFLGSDGRVKLKRNTGQDYASFVERISPDDVITSLNRLSFDSAVDNLLIGDRLILSTDDPRGLVCFDPSVWSSGVVENDIAAFVHVNAVGGLRFFPNFEAAVNNDRSLEYPVAAFTGQPLSVDYTIRDTTFNCLGNVTGYTMNTDREAIDVTALSDKFKKQFSAGLISGNGSIDCIFDYRSVSASETPLLLLQLIQRVEIGSQCDIALFLTDFNPGEGTPCDPRSIVYYDMSAVITRAGVTVTPTNVIECTIDFVTSGEVRLLVDEPSAYLVKEDEGRIEFEQTLDFQLTEAED